MVSIMIQKKEEGPRGIASGASSTQKNRGREVLRDKGP